MVSWQPASGLTPMKRKLWLRTLSCVLVKFGGSLSPRKRCWHLLPIETSSIHHLLTWPQNLHPFFSFLLRALPVAARDRLQWMYQPETWRGVSESDSIGQVWGVPAACSPRESSAADAQRVRESARSLY